jgi:hypothetical protein
MQIYMETHCISTLRNTQIMNLGITRNFRQDYIGGDDDGYWGECGRKERGRGEQITTK